jgi:hypothetical protein
MLPLKVSRRGDFPPVGLHVVDSLDNEVDLFVSVFFAGSPFDDDLVSSGVHTTRGNDYTYRRNVISLSNWKYYLIDDIKHFMMKKKTNKGRHLITWNSGHSHNIFIAEVVLMMLHTVCRHNNR